MTIKSIKSGFGIGCLIFAVAAIIALPVRFLQFFTVIEEGTGFYTGEHWSVFFLYAVLAVAIIAILFLGFARRKKLDYSLEAIKRPGLAAFSIVAAGGILLDAYNCFVKISSPVYSNSDLPMDSSNAVLALECVFAVLSAVYFIILWITYLKGKAFNSKAGVLSLAPVIWCIFRLVFRFMRTISYIRVSELMFEMIMIAFLIMFFMAFAQVNTGIGGAKNEWKIAAYGLPAALMALICFVPSFILTVGGFEELLYDYSTVEFSNIGIALFVVATILTRVTEKLPEENEIYSAEG